MDLTQFIQEFLDSFSYVTFQTPTPGAIVCLVLGVLLLFCSAFVSCSEIAFFSLSPSDISELEEEKRSVDKKIKALREDNERLLATILISNNLVNVAIIMLLNVSILSPFRHHSTGASPCPTSSAFSAEFTNILIILHR